MELNNDLITQFAKITKFNNTNKGGTTVRGTIKQSNDRNYIRIDGADEGSMTPVETTVEVSEGDRVIATVKDHSVIVTGNKTNPSVGVKTADGLRSSFEQTAGEIRAEVSNEISGVRSTITQTANDIRSEVSDRIKGVNSTITQTAKEINTRIDNLGGVDTEEFTEFKQTVEGFYFTDEDGTVYIDGGSVYAENLNLTGAITWNDLSTTAKNAINSVADDAEALASDAMNVAGDAKDIAEEALNVAQNSGIELPEYIKSTYIDFTTVESPYIIGGYLYAVGSEPGEASTFTTMDENGFYLYHNSDNPDNDGSVYPKICLSCDDTGEHISCILGSGAADDNETYNRFYIEKTSWYAAMRYVNDYSGGYVGFNFYRNGGEIQINAETISGSGGVFPIGFVYISFDTTSPASIFGGTWERISGYFLYPTGTNSKVGDLGTNYITTSTSNGVVYINVAAWRRVS